MQLFKIGADISNYVKNVQKMRAENKSFAASAKSSFKGMGKLFAGGAIGAGVAMQVRKAVDEMVSMKRLAANLGVPFEEFQVIANAAMSKLGLDAETTADAIKDLNVKITDGATGSKAYAEMFAMLGLNVKELVKLSPEQQFYAFADAIQKAGGNLSRFGLDEVNDAMFRMNGLMQIGSQGIKDLGNEMAVYGEENAAVAIELTKEWNEYVKVLSVLTTSILGGLIKGTQTLAESFMGVGDAVLRFLKIWPDDGGEFAAETAQRIKDIWSPPKDDETTKGAGDVPNPEEAKRVADTFKGIEDQRVKQEEKDASDIAAANGKIAEERDKFNEIGLDDAQKLAKVQEEIKQTREELLALVLDPFEQVAAAEAELKLAKLLNEEKQLQVDSAKEAADAAKEKADAEREANEAAKESAIGTQSEIEAERDARSEIGMTDEELLSKAQREELALAKELQRIKRDAGGIVDGKEAKEIAEAELALEKKKTEIAQLQGSLSPQDTTAPSIITSALQSIGGGGGVAVFGNDPLLNENKRQTVVLEAIRDGLYGFNPITGETTSRPEL